MIPLALLKDLINTVLNMVIAIHLIDIKIEEVELVLQALLIIDLAVQARMLTVALATLDTKGHPVFSQADSTQPHLKQPRQSNEK